MERLALSARQLRRLHAYGKMPQEFLDLVDDEMFTATHAVTLIEAKRRFGKLNIKQWIKKVQSEELSVRMLKARINEEFGEGNTKPAYFSEEGGVVKLRSVKLDPKKLDGAERAAIMEMAQRLMTLAKM